MTKALIAAFAIALVVIVAQSVAAHPGRSYWAAAKAQNTLKRQGIDWDDGTRSTVTSAHCVGHGRSIRRNRVKMFKHLTCHLQSLEDDPFTVQFHVLSKTRWRVTS
jgi:hypothetical protein